MSVKKNYVLILGVPLTHQQATALYKDIYQDETHDEDHEFYMFTDNQNMYKEVGYVYDRNPSIPHFFGVAITEDIDEIKKYLNRSPEVSEYFIETLAIYKMISCRLKKYGVVSNEPILTIVSQIS